MSVREVVREVAPGLLLAVLLAAVARAGSTVPGLSLLGPLGVALLVGISVRALVGLPAAAAPGARFSARTLLRLAVVLLGARLDLALVARAGPRILALDLVVVGAGVLGVTWIAGRLGVDRGLALLLAAGSSICGASAIAAVAPVARAREEEVSVSVGVVTLLGTLGVLGFTLLGDVLHADPVRYGVLAGASLQEVAQALAAALVRGPAAGDAATLAKLTRVVLLAPVVVGIGLVERREGTIGWRAFVPPSFVLGFIAVGAVRSLGVLPPSVVSALTEASAVLMLVSMAAIGLGVELGAVRRVGARALGIGAIGALLALAVASTGMLLLGL